MSLIPGEAFALWGDVEDVVPLPQPRVDHLPPVGHDVLSKKTYWYNRPDVPPSHNYFIENLFAQ